jgi:membrane protease YdiL (CAAX protease family)
MKRVAAGCLWLAVFLAAGMAVVPLLVALAMHKAHFARHLLAPGAEVGFDVYMFALLFAVLPGARRPPADWQPFGPAQAVWAIVGFGASLLAGGLAVYNILFVEDLVFTALHNPARANFGSPDVLAATALVGELAAALWINWYLRRLGPDRLTDGTAGGIAWRPAPPAGYAVAALCAAGIIALVIILYHLRPPDLTVLNALPMAKLFQASVWSLLPVLALIAFLAPVLEEFVFRGIAFGGLAARLGPLAAGIITTALFMLVHAEEKIHYLPGFIDVGLMAAAAAWLRVRFASIRPGILLHILYNGGLMLASGLLR